VAISIADQRFSEIPSVRLATSQWTFVAAIDFGKRKSHHSALLLATARTRP
jgi:hypothetical protein